MDILRNLAIVSLFLLFGTVAAGCGSSSSSMSGSLPDEPAAPEPAPEPEPEEPDPEEPACAESFENTFDAIQEVIFERRGCTSLACHGEAEAGGLDLRAGVSWANLVEVDSLGSPLLRIQPGRANSSYLFHKLAAASNPDQGLAITGAPMPVGVAPLIPDELEGLHIWIERGAPETGSVGATFGAEDETVLEELLGACLPPAEPTEVPRLEPPAPETGLQMAMPPYDIPPASEHEVCFAVPYDFSDIVPDRFKDETGDFYYAEYSSRRSDTNTHHLVLLNSGASIDQADDPSFGIWRCIEGDRDGEVCDPKDLQACGEGWCTSEARPSIACIGYGPAAGGGASDPERSLTVQRVEAAGFYRKLPIRGIALWNSHAFNLTAKIARHHAYNNFYYTDDLRYEQLNFRAGNIYAAAGTPPFTKRTVCETITFDPGTELLRLNSHTHKRGEIFWIEIDGERIYENYFYADPPTLQFNPPLLLDDPDPEGRTIEFCATYNNGVDDDGNPDVDVVTRLSRKPERSGCEPTHCAEGRIAEPCAGSTDDATCDTSPGAGDGMCDACPISPGVTTDDEMFILIGARVRANE